MEWVDELSGSLVCVDTAPFIYFIEENPLYLPHLRAFFSAVERGHVRVVTSILTLTEVLIHPLRQGNTQLADHYRRILLRARYVETLAVSPQIADVAARIRAEYNLRTPDALQIATAIVSGAPTFLTNDAQLAGPWLPRVLTLNQL